MKKYFNFLFVFIIGIALSSCSSEVDEVVISEPNSSYLLKSGYDPEVDIDNEISADIFSFVYKGKNYSSSYILDENSKMIYDNKEVGELVDALMENPTLASVVHSDGSVEFFVNEEERIKSFKITEQVESNLKNSTVPLYIKSYCLKVWEKAKGRKKGGYWLEFWATTPETSYTSPENINVPNLSLYRLSPHVNWDNQISSIQQWAGIGSGVKFPFNHQMLQEGQYIYATVTFYEHDSYQGRSLSFTDIGVSTPHSYRDYFGSFNFDNIASSLKVHFHN